MEINDNVFENIMKLNDNDEIFEKTMELYESVYSKYKDLKKEDHEIFRKDTKIIFTLLHRVFSNEDIEDESDEEDIERIRLVTYHLKNIIAKIDNMNLDEPSTDESESLNYILEYFKDTEIRVNELKESVSQITDRLDETNNILQRNLEISKVVKILENENLESDELKQLADIKKYFNKELKESFDKEQVIKVMENLYKKDSIDYYKIAKEISENKSEKEYSNEEKNEITKCLAIEQLISLVIKIDNKLK